MDFRILGPLEVVRGDQTLRLGSGRQLALFAVLLLHRNEAISIDRIVDHLWGESPPPTAAKIVRNSVSLLRKALGDGAELIAVLEPLVREHPLRERLRGQLMLALYRAGRQSEALAAYQEGRRLLVSELGLEPGQALQELERAILRQEQALEPPVVDRGLP